MSQRPSFDVSKLSTPDKILGGGALLLFLESLIFPWQRACVDLGALGLGRSCVGRNAWGGDGGFVGVLMGLCAILLVIGLVMTLAGVAMPEGVPVATVMTALTAGVVIFGLIKFLIAVTNHGGYGSWIGLILILAVAYGGYMKMQEGKAMPSSGG